ncbi:peptidylprolyl isomerase [Streptomyces lonarensis]|uniref:Peptidyl-prolyl cis-trans isomerase n=1 Tax=Streptomyces lonarensis TaxID=700599 RepID=A0A7X6I0S2_9ACTN|nr:peptidylprolyl isomerase [Streptomyces lonarensis]
MTACGSSDEDSSDDAGSSTEESTGTGDADDTETPQETEDEPIDAADLATEAVINTSEGSVTVELFPEEAPRTVHNFLGLADGSKAWDGQEGDTPLYEDVIFHRVIDGFMIQGGDPEGTGMGGPGYQFEDEFSDDLAFDRPYLLAMANSGPNTNGSQFFITVEPTPHLTGMHTIFGEVTDADSQAVVDAIAGTETEPGDKPVEDIVIESIDIN